MGPGERDDVLSRMCDVVGEPGPIQINSHICGEQTTSTTLKLMVVML